MKKLKIYIFYTKNIKHFLDLLIESSIGIENTEFIPILHDKKYNDCEMGKTDGSGYLELCLQNHLTKLKIMKQNKDCNIMFVDADIVFNNKQNFTNTINNLLLTNDFLFQYDSNSGMSSSINLGIIAVKCSDNAIKMWQTHCDRISKIPPHKRNQGFPQIEFNDLIKSNNINPQYQILSERFGYDHHDSYCYHAIATSTKKEALQSVLNKWRG